MSAPPRRVAAFDLGTNTFLALVAELDERGALRVVGDAFVTPRLGAGLARTGRIEPAAMERGVAALRELSAFVATHGVTPADVHAVGTAVFRRAANSDEFVALARSACGLSIEVVSGELEAELSYTAAVSALRAAGHDANVTAGDVGVIDVGGGSTELIWNGGRSRVSADVGALVLSERHLGAGAESAWPDEAWREARAEIRSALERALAGAHPERDTARRSIVVLGGTAANLACLELGFERFEPQRSEGRVLTRAGAARWSETLRVMSSARRRELPIEPSRAAILPAGLACVELALDAFGAEEAKASGRGLRYGLAWKILRS